MELTRNYPETVFAFDFSLDNQTVYFLSPTQATIHYFSIAIPKKIKPMGKVFYRPLTTGDFDYMSLHACTNSLIGTRTDMNKAAEVYKVDLQEGKVDMLTNVNGKIYQTIVKSKIDKRWIKTTDDKEMLTWVVYPPKFDPAKKYPTLLYCGGGPQNVISQSYSFRWNFQVMAAQGYIVVVPNRRGLPSFGEAWNDDISLDWGGQPFYDYLAAIDSVSKEPYVDNDKLGAVGASYGGYSVFYLEGIHEGRFKAFIAHDGVYDFASMYGTTEEVFFNNHEWGGAPWDSPQPESYAQFSPSLNVAKWDTPILIIHGLMDYRVSISQSQQAFQAAQLLGVPSKFLIFPDENHWVLKPQNSLIWYNEFYDWLAQWLK
jgi:dipeptidyl aminopeptidase/acylaminoacyl peptidase